METICYQGRALRICACPVAVVGAGAAGLNAADELRKGGMDVLLITDSLSGGTSRNAGSDKQTYYKLSLAGDFADSAEALARGYLAAGSMHGDIAYALAAGSTRAFYKLVELGVPFPQNKLGEFVGYQTDHDTSLRATSAGPLTSRYMAEALAKSVRERGVQTLEGAYLAAILTDSRAETTGLLLLDAQGPLLVATRNVVLATGGPARAYAQTVYPECQSGATGAALRAGAASENLCYWQYGLASIQVRWNVSGSYQQALPAYTDGSSPFLRPSFADGGDMWDSVFLKGYQWPYDARKENGSSRVDRAVARLRAAGGRAYLDYRETNDALACVGAEARAYLTNCSALSDSPIERLLTINEAAYEFYRSRGVDLRKEPLEIAVCAQHCNGGVAIDQWWRTSVSGLYAAGECSGAFGRYRPGGSALNETQVGALRAAQHILANRRSAHVQAQACIDDCPALSGELAFIEEAAKGRYTGLVAGAESARRDMDSVAGAVRDIDGMRALAGRVESVLRAAPGSSERGDAQTFAQQALEARDTLTVQRDTLAAMLLQTAFGGQAGHGLSTTIDPVAPDAGQYAFETKNGVARAVPVRPLPEGNGWFETVWREYREGLIFKET